MANITGRRSPQRRFHVNCVVCAKDAIVAVVELNDASHANERRAAADAKTIARSMWRASTCKAVDGGSISTLASNDRYKDVKCASG